MIYIRVSLGGTINVGNFENVKLEYEITRDVMSASGDWVDNEIEQIQRHLQERFDISRADILQKRKNKS